MRSRSCDTDGVLRLAASELISGDRVMVEQVYHAGLSRSDVARLAKQVAELPAP